MPCRSPMRMPSRRCLPSQRRCLRWLPRVAAGVWWRRRRHCPEEPRWMWVRKVGWVCHRDTEESADRPPAVPRQRRRTVGGKSLLLGRGGRGAEPVRRQEKAAGKPIETPEDRHGKRGRKSFVAQDSAWILLDKFSGRVCFSP